MLFSATAAAFKLAQVTVVSSPAAGGESMAIPLWKVARDHNGPTLRGYNALQWSIDSNLGVDHVAVFELLESTAIPEGRLSVTLHFPVFPNGGVLGRFRLSVTNSPQPSFGIRAEEALLLGVAHSELGHDVQAREWYDSANKLIEKNGKEEWLQERWQLASAMIDGTPIETAPR